MNLKKLSRTFVFIQLHAGTQKKKQFLKKIFLINVNKSCGLTHTHFFFCLDFI